MGFSDYSEAQIDKLIEQVYAGAITPKALPIGLYRATGKHLTDGIYKGYGATIKEFEYGSPNFAMLKELRENAYIFSAAKTFQEVKEITSLIVQEDKIIPFSKFKTLAMEKIDLYNVTYLETEYNFAVGQARAASEWQSIEKDKDTVPYLTYQTVEDANVRHEHALLDGITKAVDDPFWDIYYPKNDFGCRCGTVSKSEAEETDLSTREIPDIPPLFQYNVGKDKIIFKSDHPYFDVPAQYKELAKQNFNFKIPPI